MPLLPEDAPVPHGAVATIPPSPSSHSPKQHVEQLVLVAATLIGIAIVCAVLARLARAVPRAWYAMTGSDLRRVRERWRAYPLR